MRSMRSELYYLFLQQLKRWINRIGKRHDDDDNRFDHPYIIF